MSISNVHTNSTMTTLISAPSLAVFNLEILKIFSLWQAVPIFLIIIGITWTMSFERRNTKFFESNYLKNKLERLYFPYILIVLISIVVGLFSFLVLNFNIIEFNSYNLIGTIPVKMINHTSDYGSYFITLIFQAVLLFPFLMVLYRKNKKLLILVGITSDVLFQIFSFYYLPPGIYDVCIFRYLLAIILGILIYEKVDIKIKLVDFIIENKIYLLFFIVGALYMIMWYLNQNMGIPYFNNKFNMFSSENLFSFLYVQGIVILGLYLLPNKTNNKLFLKLGFVGKSSYHIFLFQLLWFKVFSLTRYIKTDFSILLIICDTILCLMGGIAFYYLEKKIRVILKNFNYLNIINRLMKNRR